MMERPPSESKHRIDKFGYSYFKKKQLGKGAYSYAYLYERTGQLSPNPFNNFFYSHHLADTKYCVMKYYLERLQSNQGLSFSTLRQINLMLTSNHPNIVTAHEVYFKWEKVHLIMDLFLDLSLVIHNDKISDHLLEKKKICYHITRGLAHLHDNYILHRDLKPDNIFVSRDGICKIGDFGMSKYFGTPGRKYTPGVCTMQYRAPELFLNTNFYNEKIDIWSLGCIYYYVLTGQHLFSASLNEMGIIKQIFSITGTPDESNWVGYKQLPKNYIFEPFPKKKLSVQKGLSEQIGSLIQLCLNNDPKKRWRAKDLLKHPFFSQFNDLEELPALDVSEMYDKRLQALVKIQQKEGQYSQ